MNTLHTHKTALTVGTFMALYHFVWSVLVALRWGQTLLDFILWAHMFHLSFVVGPFEMQAAATLIVLTFAIGALMGYAFALIWNWLHRSA